MEHNEELVVDHIQRITQLEDRMKANETLTSRIDTSLDKVTKELSAIKWLAAGGLLAFLVHEMGIVEVLKLFIST